MPLPSLWAHGFCISNCICIILIFSFVVHQQGSARESARPVGSHYAVCRHTTYCIWEYISYKIILKEVNSIHRTQRTHQLWGFLAGCFDPELFPHNAYVKIFATLARNVSVCFFLLQICSIFSIIFLLSHLVMFIAPSRIAKLSKYLDIWLFGYLSASKNLFQLRLKSILKKFAEST